MESLDRELFLWLNSKHTPFFDNLMLTITILKTWIPMYILLMGWFLYHFGLKKGLKVIGLVILGVVLCDLLVSGLLKPLIGRVRPCHDASLTGLVHVVDKQCRGWFSFPSGHAANSFVIAEITFLITQKKIRWVLWLYLWAIIVAYSRIYVGVHYPLDILAGIGTGAFVGFGLVQIFKKSILKA